MGTDTPRYGIEDLASLGGVSRRTVRYYVQESLLPVPLGMGRGRHYGPDHLERLLAVKAMQEAGRSLDEIRRTLAEGPAADSNMTVDGTFNIPVPGAPASLPDWAARSLWRRVILAQGIELHIAADVPLPSAMRLQELAAWCRTNLPGRGEGR
jgi:DNA-binding transcriptional MerR regulator